MMGRIQQTYAYKGREWSLADIEYILRGTMTFDVTDEALIQRQIRLSSAHISEKVEQSNQESGEEVDRLEEEVVSETGDSNEESEQGDQLEEKEVAESDSSDSSDKESTKSESDKSEESEEDYRCHRCNEEFEDEGQLITHIKAEHVQREATKEAKVQSPYKNKLITLLKAIPVSKRMPTNDNEERNEQKPLSDMSAIRDNSQQKNEVPQHGSYDSIKSANSENEVSANEAPKRYKHDVVVTPETSKISCEICGQKFSARNNLTRHIKSIHSSRRFPCLKCRKLFSRQDKLNDHSERCSSKDPLKDPLDP
jgi:uncharacterized C2H2 Zn-finger protein